MDEIEELKALEAKVVGGYWEGQYSLVERLEFDNLSSSRLRFGRAKTAWAAYHGSLDSAKALHQSVLGDKWSRSVDATAPETGITVSLHKIDNIHVDCSGDLLSEARAWFLAIIRVLISESEAEDE